MAATPSNDVTTPKPYSAKSQLGERYRKQKDMYCSSPDPCAEWTQFAGRMGGATQSSNLRQSTEKLNQ